MTRRGEESNEAGYILVAVIFMVALVVLSLAIAAPRIAASIQRDREVELVHRGEQYKRAIRLYYKKFGSYPSSIDQLEKTNEIRFLRKRYTDPLTGKDDWKLIRMGQAHVRPLGFFGQTLGMSTATSAAGGLTGSSTLGGSGLSSGTGGSSSMFGSSSGSSSTAVGATGSTAGTSSGGGLYAPATTDDGTGSSSGSSGSSSSSSSGSSSDSSSGSSSGSTSSGSSSTGASTSTTGGLGVATSTTLGGPPVVGVVPPMTKSTILLYKLKSHYNEWEFVYDPVEEQTAAGSILGGAGNINGTGNSVNGPGSSSTTGGFGSSSTSSTSSTTTSGSSTSTSNSATTTPQ